MKKQETVNWCPERFLHHNKNLSSYSSNPFCPLAAFPVQHTFVRTNTCVKGQIFGPVIQTIGDHIHFLKWPLVSQCSPEYSVHLLTNASILSYIPLILCEHYRILEFQEAQTQEGRERRRKMSTVYTGEKTLEIHEMVIIIPYGNKVITF